jgi:NAD(P)-dependent dehydrogenase (short-subunit alcohol dehydrogenase family)
MTRFEGRTAVITGGSTGLGLATGHLLAREGASVVLAGRNERRGIEAADAIGALGGEATFVRVDVGVDADVARLAEIASANTGAIDLWFANAGIEGPVGEIADWEDSDIADVLATNIKGVLSGFRHASPKMPRGSLMVLNGSFVGPVLPLSNSIPYAASKSAVVTAGRAAAGAFEPLGITVVTVCPYMFDTPMVERIAGGDDANEIAAALTPSGLLGRPEEVAEVVAGLWDGSVDATSGDALLVDAGPTLSLLASPQR